MNREGRKEGGEIRASRTKSRSPSVERAACSSRVERHTALHCAPLFTGSGGGGRTAHAAAADVCCRKS